MNCLISVSIKCMQASTISAWPWHRGRIVSGTLDLVLNFSLFLNTEAMRFMSQWEKVGVTTSQTCFGKTNRMCFSLYLACTCKQATWWLGLWARGVATSDCQVWWLFPLGVSEVRVRTESRSKILFAQRPRLTRGPLDSRKVFVYFIKWRHVWVWAVFAAIKEREEC